MKVTGFMMYGRPIFYLALSPSVWNTFMYNGKKASTNCIMFNILLDYKIFGTIDRRGFIPCLRKKKKVNNNKGRKTDSEMLYVVKLEPKADLLKLFDGKDSLIYFWHFVRHHFYKPSLRVIPALEKIVPDCGLRLIEKNYNIFTEFGHLSPSQVFDLFIEFKSWPEFKDSSFLLSANEIKKTYDPYMEECE
ncbi:dimethyladenosine transferase 2, mitochondrial isoform X2 [Ceratina calcarata]|uniref:Dimethyladenosine transferase 2, mitochondrial isoform X2 n=1 Tax=Ceratina calcarata TaxID=156304 RepID=A0AAJ7SA84_9HYME|nr:dimethyladenosine transferase 2, mitochondrial isoform X2 [Ceratina calcarata]